MVSIFRKIPIAASAAILANLTIATALLGASAAGAADPYPNKAVKVIVPYVAGGPTDVYARMLSKNMSDILGTPFIVDNKGGAATIIGAEVAARAPNDGYTLMFSVMTTLSSNPLLYKKLPYKVEDFTPIAEVAKSTFVLAVSPTLPAKTAQEFVAYVKANPGKVAMGSLGIGTGPYIVGKTFARVAGLDMIEVSYKGSAAAMTDLLGGNISVYFDGLSSALPQYNAGKVRVLAVASAKRNPAMPDVPTFAELGYQDLVISAYWAFFAPAGTPKDIVSKLSAAAIKSANDDTFKARLLAEGVTVETSTPEGLADLIKRDSEAWQRAITPLNMPLQ
jgi:tripartite-type tricarboxylate transporter receptor subunit TctC